MHPHDNQTPNGDDAILDALMYAEKHGDLATLREFSIPQELLDQWRERVQPARQQRSFFSNVKPVAIATDGPLDDSPMHGRRPKQHLTRPQLRYLAQALLAGKTREDLRIKHRLGAETIARIQRGVYPDLPRDLAARLKANFKPRRTRTPRQPHPADNVTNLHSYSNAIPDVPGAREQELARENMRLKDALLKLLLRNEGI
jgi:hypothetical protein